MKMCFLLGHRDVSDDLRPLLIKNIERHITECGVEEFWLGRKGHFDYLAAQCLLEMKKLHPHIRLMQLAPYHPGVKKSGVWEGFDGCIYPEGQETAPLRLCITRANHYALARCHYMITYAWQPGSNALKAAESAEKMGKSICNLAKIKEDAF